MMIAIAQKNDRLDQVAYRHYGTLNNFDEVLENNQHLVSKYLLDDDDQVYLPDYIPPTTDKAVSLW